MLKLLGALVIAAVPGVAQTIDLQGPPSSAEEARLRATAGFTADYFEGRDFQTLRFLRHDYQVNFDWGTAGPDRTSQGPQVPITTGPIASGVPEDAPDEQLANWPSTFTGNSPSSITTADFSVYWYGGVLPMEGPGTYGFRMELGPEDHAELRLGDGVSTSGEEPAEVDLTGDEPTVVEIRYRHPGGADATAKLLWRPPGAAAWQPVPTQAMRRLDGARARLVDESVVNQTLIVDQQRGNDASADGSNERPYATPQAAVQKALGLSDGGESVRVVLRPGMYRLDDEIRLMESADEDRTEKGLIVIEGQGDTGSVVLSGSAITARPAAGDAGGWQPVDGVPGLYRRDWPYDFGFHRGSTARHRREMILLTVGGQRKPLDQVILENFKGKHHNNLTWVGYNDPRTTLKPGQYGVAEFGPANAGEQAIHGIPYDPAMHPGDDNTLFLRLPDGMSFGDIDLIEVATLATPLRIARDRIVVRNVVIEGAASYQDGGGTQHSAALMMGERDKANGVASDIVLDDLTVQDVGGRGAWLLSQDSEGQFGAPGAMSLFTDNLPYLRRVTFRNFTVQRTGTTGISSSPWDSLYDGLIVRDGSWRSPGSNAWSLRGQRNTVRNARVSHFRGRGLRNDHEAEHFYITDSAFNYHAGFGVQFEVGFGPIVLDRVQIIGNGEAGLFVLNNDGVTLIDSVVANNGYMPSKETRRGQVVVTDFNVGRVDRELGGVVAAGSDDLAMFNTTLVSQFPEAPLVYYHGPQWRFDRLFAAGDRYVGRNNTFYATTENAFAGGPFEARADLQRWRTLTGEEDATWSAEAQSVIPSDFQKVDPKDHVDTLFNW